MCQVTRTSAHAFLGSGPHTLHSGETRNSFELRESLVKADMIIIYVTKLTSTTRFIFDKTLLNTKLRAQQLVAARKNKYNNFCIITVYVLE